MYGNASPLASYGYTLDSHTVPGESGPRSTNQYTDITATGSATLNDRYGAGFVYDDNGNLHKRYRGAAVTPTETYYYDFQNRLVRIVNDDGTKLEYEYDALGRLIRRFEINSVDTITEGRAYIYDGWRLLEERDTLASSETSLRALYFYGSEGLNDLVMMRMWDGITAPSSSNYVDHWFHQDDMGNIIALSDEDGDIEEYYICDDFGVPTAFNAAGVEQSTPISPFLFTGQMWDADAKLYYCRMRWYDPYLGRFTSRDPLGLWGDPLNLGNGQAYVGHSPWSWVDPMGLEGCPTVEDWISSQSYEWHHLFPQQFWNTDEKAARFGFESAKDARAVFDSPEFGWLIPRSDHSDLHFKIKWNEDWANYLVRLEQAGVPPTVSDIRRRIKAMKGMEKYRDFFIDNRTYKASLRYMEWRAAPKEAKFANVVSGLKTRGARELTERELKELGGKAGKVRVVLKGGGKLLGRALVVGGVVLMVLDVQEGYAEDGITGAAYYGMGGKDLEDAAKWAGDATSRSLHNAINESDIGRALHDLKELYRQCKVQ